MEETKNFIATWPELGISVECEPHEDGRNKWIYDWYIEHMPIKFLQLHAMCTGAVMYTWCKVNDDLPQKGDNIIVNTQINEMKAGSGHFSYNIPNGLAGGRFAHIAFHYTDESYEDMPGYTAFKVADRDLDKLRKVGEEVARSIYKTKKIITCELTVKEN